MNKTVTRVLWIIAGVLLFAAGIVSIMEPSLVLESLSFILGIAMLFSGIVDIIIFVSAHDAMYGSVWFLLDGIFTILMSLFILCNQAFTMLSLPFVLGMWLVFSGVSRFVNSCDLMRLGVRGWG